MQREYKILCKLISKEYLTKMMRNNFASIKYLCVLIFLFFNIDTIFAQENIVATKKILYYQTLEKDYKVGILSRFDMGVVLEGYDNVTISPISKIMIESHLRVTKLNIYFSPQLRFSFPIGRDNLFYRHINDYNLEFAFGVGGYLYDARNLTTAKGWSIMLSGVFYFTLTSFGEPNYDVESSITNFDIGQGRGSFGPEIQARFNYNFNRLYALVLGVDMSYNFTSMLKVDPVTITQNKHLMHGLSLGVSIGLMFF